jgi:hypothetical protein
MVDKRVSGEQQAQLRKSYFDGDYSKVVEIIGNLSNAK